MSGEGVDMPPLRFPKQSHGSWKGVVVVGDEGEDENTALKEQIRQNEVELLNEQILENERKLSAKKDRDRGTEWCCQVLCGCVILLAICIYVSVSIATA